jgi:hypothetical protein
MADKYAGPSEAISEAMSEAMTSMAQNAMSNKMSKRKPMEISNQSTLKKKTAWSSDGSDRFDTYEKMDSARRNKVANTPMARAKYADKPPKINLRKAYPE